MSLEELSKEEKDRIAAFYGKLDPLRGAENSLLEAYKIISSEYDDVVHLLAVPHQNYVEELENRLGKSEIESKHILDLGAGTGLCGEVLRNAGFENVDALDISSEMLEEARKKNIYKNLFCGRK